MNNKSPRESPPSSSSATSTATGASSFSAASSSTATPRESPKVPPGLGLEVRQTSKTARPTLGEWTFQDDFDMREAKLKYLLLSGQWGIKEYEEERTGMFWELQFGGGPDPELTALKGRRKGGMGLDGCWQAGRKGSGSSQPRGIIVGK